MAIVSLKIYAVLILVLEPATFGSEVSTQRSDTDQSIESLLFSLPNPGSSSKEWQVGRVSRKHYEVIHMFRRRTNIFVDVDDRDKTGITNPVTTSPTVTQTKDLRKREDEINPKKTITKNYFEQKFYKQPIFQHTTPSYIEFYYLEEVTNFGEMKQNLKQKTNDLTLRFEKYTTPSYKNKESMDKKLFSRSSRFLFHLYDSFNQSNANHSAKRNIRINDKINDFHFNLKALEKIFAERNNRSFNEKTFVENYNTEHDVSSTRFLRETLTSTRITVEPTTKITESEHKNKSSTNDRVIFFEIYDSDTEDPLLASEYSYEDNSTQDSKNLKVKYDETHSVFPNATADFKTLTTISLKNITNSTSNFNNETTNSLKKVVQYKKVTERSVKLVPRRSQQAHWEEYPYIAAYIYEKYQVHCDAAIISAHWLLAAGSCLSRHSEDPSEEGRSAFVAYCGGPWWDPERIAYVTYSVVHPMFNPRDRSKKYLYNIGLIRVVSSMQMACPKWEPVLVMSYHYPGGDDSVAVAVGWGLDRYGVKYSSSDLPRRPLSVYAGSVYTNICPGNNGYQNAKDENVEGLKNVYCLALPNYTSEDSDPLHGGLLVVGGKLIALYLQEERRMQGDQSAEYTGVWRLFPWVNEVAKEPEQADFL